MAKLTIKNVGAINDVEFDVNRINVFIGPQSSGKSTISKILCHCQWVEKSCFMDSKELAFYQRPGFFYDSLVKYHKMEGFFNKNASIKYEGDYMSITYTHSSKKTTIRLKNNASYSYPKISYIPSERNFVAAVPNFNKYYNEGKNVILYFGYDWNDAKMSIKELDFNDLLGRHIKYENLKDEDYIYDDDNQIKLENASSGVQSILPLYQTILYMIFDLYGESRVLSPSKENARKDLNVFLLRMQDLVQKHIISDNENTSDINQLITIFNSINIQGIKHIDKLTDLQESELLKNISDSNMVIGSLFNYRYTQLFIEEPEQNLFPDTQQEFIYWLLSSITNSDKHHAVVITTHSPYILFALNNCMMGGLVNDNIPDDKKNSFASHNSWIDPKLVSIFEICDGGVKRIQDKDGIIEDNYLNRAYKKNSNEYLSLLNYYEDEE